jgi:hypothetical protein
LKRSFWFVEKNKMAAAEVLGWGPTAHLWTGFCVRCTEVARLPWRFLCVTCAVHRDAKAEKDWARRMPGSRVGPRREQQSRVARFLLVQQTKTEKIYQMATKYTN